MRLCWIIPGALGGGVSSVALSCCRMAAKAGHEVTLLMSLRPAGHLDEYAAGFKVDSLGIDEESADAPIRLIQWLDRHPQDVVFFNGCSEVEPSIPVIPRSIRCVYVVHDTAYVYWNTAVKYEDSLDAIIAVSHVVAGEFQHHLNRPERLHVLHNGTLLPEIKLPGERPDDLLFLGGSQLHKGVFDTLNVWERLMARGFGGRLHWYGTIEPKIENEIKQLPGRDRVLTYGHVPRSQIFERASRSKVLLLFSRTEPFGMVTVETMGMGCLPVAWNIKAGTKEIIEEGTTGFLAPLGDTDAAADLVLKACAEHPTLHEQAMQVARTQFSEDALWRRYGAAICEITGQASAKRPHAGQPPTPYQPPTRYFQLLPEGIRTIVRYFLGKRPRIDHWLSNWRGS